MKSTRSLHLQRKERLEGNMKKRSRRKFYILILVWILLIVFTGRYFFHQAPLSMGDVQTILHENWEDIQSITDWLVHSEYETIYLSEEDLHTGEAWADFSAIPLDEEILLQAQRLINEKGFHGISKNAGENTIAFYMWTDGIEADCGASYPIDSASEPYVQYQISVQPLQEANWFYFYSDYNKWRETDIPAIGS